MDSQKPSFCMETALERVGGDYALFQEISVLFMQEYPALQADMENAIRDTKSHDLMVAAHTLKGSLATFCAWDAKVLSPARRKPWRN
jgi:HPt (histidine-containing phosphotransfer) domain-containing protein